MKIGLFGGSFDPIHEGHVGPVLEARRRLALDRVLFLPTAAPPHKPRRSFAPALARYAMVELALLDQADLEVSTHELTLDRPAYTVETLEHFHATAPEAELFLLMGADSWLDFESWMRWREILTLARLVVLTRPGFRIGETRSPLAPEIKAATAAGQVHFVENAPRAVSSTEVRRRLAAGEEIPPGWLQPRVVRYLSKYRLYR
ncbi:MAG: nicotinate-nucleotide adenylyltransferase [Thermoanaerobaculia bacterium]